MNARTRHMAPEDLAGRRWRGLVRESTQAQADKWSPERQRQDITRAAEELGMIGDGVWYERIGSGESEHSPELAQALADAQAGRYDVLVVFATSRFARNVGESRRLKAEFARAGVVIYFVMERLVSGSYTGALTEGLHELLDEHANEERRMWIAGGQRQRQLAGKWLGAIPLGYRKVMVDRPDGSRGWDGDLEPDPVTAPLVVDLFQRRARGGSVPSIAAAVGKPVATVRQLLANPVYTGRLVRYRRARSQHYYDAAADNGRAEVARALPALIPDALFERVNA